MLHFVAAKMTIALEHCCSSLNGDTKALWWAEMVLTLTI